MQTKSSETSIKIGFITDLAGPYQDVDGPNMYINNRTVTDFFSYYSKDRLPGFGVNPFVSVGISYGM